MRRIWRTGQSERLHVKPELLEELIRAWRIVGTHEPDVDKRRFAFERMGQLIGMRSPETVARMEAEKGLR